MRRLPRPGLVVLAASFALAAGLLSGPLAAVAAAQERAVRWANVGPGGGGFLQAIAIDPRDPRVIYVGSDCAGVHKTMDGGGAWAKRNRGLLAPDLPALCGNVFDLAVDPAQPDTLYAATRFGLFRSDDAASLWRRVALPPVERPASPYAVTSCVAIDPDASAVYVGTGDRLERTFGQGGIYLSTDRGATFSFRRIAGASAEAAVLGIAVDPAAPPARRAVFVATTDGLFATADGGTTFEPRTQGLPHGNLRRVAVAGSGAARTLLVTAASGPSKVPGEPPSKGKAASGVFASRDGGASWERAEGLPTWDGENAEPMEWEFIAGDPRDPKVAYAGVAGPPDLGIFVTRDAGRSFARTASFPTGPVRLPFGILGGNVDRGCLEGWSLMVSFLAVAPSRPEVVVFGSNDVYVSEDGGSHFAQRYCERAAGDAWRGRGIEAVWAYAVGFHPTDASRIYVGYDDIALWGSADDGASFRPVTPVNRPPSDAIGGVLVDPQRPERIWACQGPHATWLKPPWTEPWIDGTVWRSTDSGATWGEVGVPGGLPRGKAELALDPRSPVEARTLYAAVLGRGVHRSADAGDTWQPRNGGLDAAARRMAYRIALSTAAPGRLWLGANAAERPVPAGLWRSDDGGGMWRPVAGGLPAWDVYAIAEDPSDASLVFCALAHADAEDGALYASRDGGATWEVALAQPHVTSVAFSPRDASVVYAASSSWWRESPRARAGVWSSADRGRTWARLQAADGVDPHSFILAVIPDPRASGEEILWLCTRGGGLYRGVVAPR